MFSPILSTSYKRTSSQAMLDRAVMQSFFLKHCLASQITIAKDTIETADTNCKKQQS